MMKMSLKWVILIEIAAVFIMVIGLLPQWFAFLLAAFILYYIFAFSLENALFLFIVSIPLYTMLPFSYSFDSMASWRIVIVFLFIKWAVAKFIEYDKSILRFMNYFFPLSRLSIFTTIFIGVLFLSLLNAKFIGVGLRQILFFINIFLLFPIVFDMLKTHKDIIRVLEATAIAAAITLAIGYIQFISLLFYSLYSFWQYWTNHVIPVFYGQRLADLLSRTNTWFSYYEDSPPTLRMFSIFPDSHSFALFSIISASIFAILYFSGKEFEKPRWVFGVGLLFSLSAVLFSGSRGTWISVAVPFFAGLFLIFSRKLFYFIRMYIDKRVLRNVFATLIIFLFIFPLSSFFFPHGKGVQDTEESKLAFKRAKSIFDIEETSNKDRFGIWLGGLKSVKKKPLLGVGVGNFPLLLDEDISSGKKGASAHNLYLNIAAEAGIAGLVALFLIIWEILLASWKVFTSSRNNFSRYYGAVFGLYFLWILGYNMFDVVLFNDKVLLLFMVPVAILYAIYNKKSEFRTVSFR